MDYKYIEQLLERYFDCQTTLQEERILQSFFEQEDVPASLLCYRELFVTYAEARQEELGSGFDARMLALVGETERTERPAEQPRRVEMRSRIAPFFRAAAVVAMVLTIGNAAEQSLADDPIYGDTQPATVSPYIRKADIASTVRVKDVTQAEARPATDSIFVSPVEPSSAQ